MQQELQKVIVGQDEVIEQLFAAIFTRGHCLLEGVPGLAKTLMVSTLARILDVGFKRIQFTPDLMPSDITGTNVLEEDERGKRRSALSKDPVFTNILLADEINRTPAQDPGRPAAGDAGAPGDGGPHDLRLCPIRSSPSPRRTRSSRKEPTRCPKPSSTASCSTSRSAIRRRTKKKRSCPSTTPQREGRGPQGPLRPGDRQPPEAGQLRGGQRVHRQVRGPAGARDAARRTRTAPQFVQELVDWGAGPRAGQFLINGGKALAAMDGRFSVAIDDIRKIAVPVLRHRISTNFQAQAEGHDDRRPHRPTAERDPRTGGPEVRGKTPPPAPRTSDTNPVEQGIVPQQPRHVAGRY